MEDSNENTSLFDRWVTEIKIKNQQFAQKDRWWT